MKGGQAWWRFFKMAAVIVGSIVAAFWIIVVVILTLGPGGTVVAVLLFPMVVAALGLFLAFSFTWQALALARTGDLLERILESARKRAQPPPK